MRLDTAFDFFSFLGNVYRHRWTGRYEAHLWDKSTWNQNQNKKGKQGLSLLLSILCTYVVVTCNCKTDSVVSSFMCM